MNFLGQGFQELEHYRQTDRPTRLNALLRRIGGWWLLTFCTEGLQAGTIIYHDS